MSRRSVLPLFAATVLAACGPSREEVNLAQFEAYQAAREAGDVERAMAYLAGGFRIVPAGGGEIDRDHARDLLAWDAVVGARTEWDRKGLEVRKEGIAGDFTEYSTFHDLIGAAGGRRTHLVFRFDREGGITEIRTRTLPGQIPLQEKLNPFLDWMRKNRPEELAEIYPGDRIRYDGESADRWLAALRGWRDDIRVP